MTVGCNSCGIHRKQSIAGLLVWLHMTVPIKSHKTKVQKHCNNSQTCRSMLATEDCKGASFCPCSTFDRQQHKPVFIRDQRRPLRCKHDLVRVILLATTSARVKIMLDYTTTFCRTAAGINSTISPIKERLEQTVTAGKATQSNAKQNLPFLQDTPTQ